MIQGQISRKAQLPKTTKTQLRLGSSAKKNRLRVANRRSSSRERDQYRDAADLCASVFAIMDDNVAEAVSAGIGKSELRYVYLREIYRAVAALLNDQPPNQLEETFRMALNSRPPYCVNRSLFSLAIQVYEKDRSERTSKATRSVWASALEYALRHNKTAEDVPEFLVDVGGVKKAADLARDPQMVHHWAVIR